MNSQKNWQENLTFRELLHEKRRHHVKENDAGQLAEIGKTAGKRKIQGKTQHVLCLCRALKAITKFTHCAAAQQQIAITKQRKKVHSPVCVVSVSRFYVFMC